MSGTSSDRIAPAVASIKANFGIGDSVEANKQAKEYSLTADQFLPNQTKLKVKELKASNMSSLGNLQ